jgi:hypothetical protein
MIEASHFNVNEAYAAVERHQLSDYEPHIYRTLDSGKTWTEIKRGLARRRVRANRQRRSDSPGNVVYRH